LADTNSQDIADGGVLGGNTLPLYESMESTERRRRAAQRETSDNTTTGDRILIEITNSPDLDTENSNIHDAGMRERDL